MAPVIMEWERRLGRRLRVRDLFILSAVVQSRSMAKAARQLAISQPAVSEAIANLEHLLGVRLVDRSPRGVSPTIYADALLKRSVAVFDELKQSVRDIEFLSDPTVGELRVGCPESISSGILRPIMQKFSRDNPRVAVHVHDVVAPTLELSELRQRKLDLVFARLVKPPGTDPFEADLNVETLFNDQLVVATGAASRWARRRPVDLAELVNERWISDGPET